MEMQQTFTAAFTHRESSSHPHTLATLPEPHVTPLPSHVIFSKSATAVRNVNTVWRLLSKVQEQDHTLNPPLLVIRMSANISLYPIPLIPYPSSLFSLFYYLP